MRPLSYYPTWLCLKLGISANQVTCLSILVGCVCCILLGSGDYWHTVIGAIALNFASLGDYIDGGVARYTKTTSKFGAFLDTMNGYLMFSLIPIGLGIGLFNNPDSALASLANLIFGMDVVDSIFLVIGFSAALFFTFGLLISSRFALVFSLATPSDHYKAKSGAWASVYEIGFALLNPVGVLIPVLTLAAIFRFTSIFLMFWSLLALAALVVIILRTITNVGAK